MDSLASVYFFLRDIELYKALILVAGLAFVVIEMFHPGFGAPGITGGLLLILAIVLISSNLFQALILIVIILAFLGVVLAAVIRSAKSGHLSKTLILDDSLDSQSGFNATEVYSDIINKEGTTITPLRPAGTALIEGVKYDVVTEGEFIHSYKNIKVIKVEGRRIVVKEI